MGFLQVPMKDEKWNEKEVTQLAIHFDRKSLFTSFGLRVWGVGMTWVSLNPLDFTADTFDLKKNPLVMDWLLPR